MLLINFPSYRILSIDIQSSLLYAVLVHRASYQCEIKIISVNHSSLTVLDTLVVRGSEQKYSLPKVKIIILWIVIILFKHQICKLSGKPDVSEAYPIALSIALF